MAIPVDPSRRPVIALVLLAVLAGAAPPLPAAPTEQQVKAVFLFNFSRFVDWPQEAFAAADAPLVIGVLGDDPFGADLDAVVRGESVRGHPLTVRRFASVEQIDHSEQRRLERILDRLAGRSILTVADAEDAARRGVMIHLVTERNRVRLRINLGASEAVGLTLSSKLLRPAQIVDGRES
jgi:hypothetical protein